MELDSDRQSIYDIQNWGCPSFQAYYFEDPAPFHYLWRGLTRGVSYSEEKGGPCRQNLKGKEKLSIIPKRLSLLEKSELAIANPLADFKSIRLAWGQDSYPIPARGSLKQEH